MPTTWRDLKNSTRSSNPTTKKSPADLFRERGQTLDRLMSESHHREVEEEIRLRHDLLTQIARGERSADTMGKLRAYSIVYSYFRPDHISPEEAWKILEEEKLPSRASNPKSRAFPSRSRASNPVRTLPPIPEPAPAYMSPTGRLGKAFVEGKISAEEAVRLRDKGDLAIVQALEGRANNPAGELVYIPQYRDTEQDEFLDLTRSGAREGTERPAYCGTEQEAWKWLERNCPQSYNSIGLSRVVVAERKPGERAFRRLYDRVCASCGSPSFPKNDWGCESPDCMH